jgi:olefin beta-lactone synthetase
VPVIVVECKAHLAPKGKQDRARLEDELRALAGTSPKTAAIRTVLFHPSLPVDPRHNAKIIRERLAEWAASELPSLARAE